MINFFSIFHTAQALTLQVSYPTISGLTPTSDLSSYLKYIYLFGLGASGIIAMVMIIWGGIKYASSEVITSKEDARKDIQNALFGLALLMSAYLILNTINPNLVSLTAPRIKKVSSVVFCSHIGESADPNKGEACCDGEGLINQNNRCVASSGLTENQTCYSDNCQSPLTCFGVTKYGSGTCKNKAKSGEFCYDSHDCETGLDCTSGGSLFGTYCYHAAGQRQSGEYCSASGQQAECASGLTCSSNKCATKSP